MLRGFLARIRARFENRDAELDDEIGAHLELLTQAHVRRGLTPEQARLAARRDFGGVEQMKETYRDRRALRWGEDLWRDVRYSLRTLARAPGFTAVAVLSLGLGIGANASIFGLVDAALLESLPVKDPERLVLFASRRPADGASNHAFSYDLYQALRRQPRSLVDVIASTPIRLNVEVDGSAEGTAEGQLASGNY
ncbi:MAG: permease prefix domain 1-containing protein, partial [Vicinamibacterales bacterium]